MPDRLTQLDPCAVLLVGEDAPARAARLEELVAERLQPEERAFNLERLSARDGDPATLATLLDTPPLFAGARVVVLEEAGAASAAVARAVGEFLERPPGTTLLVAVADGKPLGEPWATLRRVGREEVFEPPRGAAAIAARVREEARRAGKEIAPAAAALLAELNPEGTAVLPAEVAKAAARAGERPRIELEDVQAVAVSSAGADRYLFVDLVGMGRRAEALAELHALLEGGESPIYLVTLLTQHFLLLGGIRACEARGVRSPAAVAAALGKPAWLLTRRNYRIRGHEPPQIQARRYDRRAVDAWLAGLLELDVALKSSRLPPAALMEDTVLRLLSATPAAA